jgi:molybdenum cofactor biosynthesis enzyme MoaA
MFVDDWRRRGSAAFDLATNSTAKRLVSFTLWGRPFQIYANANLSIYSGQPCNAACSFCVEEIRPASRGIELASQKSHVDSDVRYFGRLEEVLSVLRPLSLSVSVTGGEPSKDARLPQILRTIKRCNMRKRTVTTNGSGLLDVRGDRRVIDWIAWARCNHLNISVAHPDRDRNAQLMRLRDALTVSELKDVVEIVSRHGVRVRLSCVLLRSGIGTFAEVCRYLDFAQALGVDNVIFRQLMTTDPATHLTNGVVRFSSSERVPLEPLLDQISSDPRFAFTRQILGYYYYVEVWRYRSLDVVFEQADLAQLEKVKRHSPDCVHEMVFHPNAVLSSTWQPWDGLLGPP